MTGKEGAKKRKVGYKKSTKNVMPKKSKKTSDDDEDYKDDDDDYEDYKDDKVNARGRESAMKVVVESNEYNDDNVDVDVPEVKSNGGNDVAESAGQVIHRYV